MSQMSVLEFVSSLKWPIVVLTVLGYGARLVKTHPGVGTWLKAWLDRRNINAQVLGAQLQTTDSTPPAAVMTAPDDALPEGQAQEIRREAAEQLMRQATAWGWHAHRVGARMPVPQIEMRGDQPVITFADYLTARPSAQQQNDLVQNWYRQHLADG
jgi:hypothetical protein